MGKGFLWSAAIFGGLWFFEMLAISAMFGDTDSAAMIMAAVTLFGIPINLILVVIANVIAKPDK
jgi:hypothetical protein